MTYPSKVEIYMQVLTGGYESVACRYGLTIAEVASIYATEQVSPEMQAWADDLRARCPKAFEVPHAN